MLCDHTRINTADKTIIAALQNIIFRVNNCSVGYIAEFEQRLIRLKLYSQRSYYNMSI